MQDCAATRKRTLAGGLHDRGGDITLAGRLNADQLTSNGTGGSITLRAGGDIVSLANSILSCTGGILGFGGGDMDFGANGKITLGDVLDVSGSDAGTVTLTAGDLISIQQIKANGTGDGGAGGSVIITAATSVRLMDTTLLQGQASSTVTGAGDGGTASIEADYGDVVIAAAINASGFLPDGSGGEIDLCAQGAIDIQSGTLNARAEGSQGTGGLITMEANQSVTDNGGEDASGGAGGGEVDICAGSAITLNAPLDVSGRGLGSVGGTVSAEAGQGGVGSFTINTTIDVSGGGCMQDSGCGTGGQACLTGCNLIVASSADIKAGAPAGGEIDLTVCEQLTVNGKVNAAATTAAGTDGRNVVTYPLRKTPMISANLVMPAPMLVGKATCTPASLLNCLLPCPICGNGIVEFPETCDDGPVGSARSCDGCNPFCQTENCDDGKVCTLDSCDNRLGCRNVPAPTPCTEPPTPTRTIPASATITPTPTSISTVTTTSTPTSTPSASSTPSPTATASSTSTAPQPPTQTTTSTPTPIPVRRLPGDANCDGRLSAADLIAVVRVLGPEAGDACPLVDFNQDGVVDRTDLADTTLVEFIDLGSVPQP